jgi:hypothetical protein
MRLLLDSVVKRLAGKGGDPVVQLQTAFGGGKTHTLLAVYHLAKGETPASKMQGVPPILDAAGISELPKARVAVLDGVDLLDLASKPRVHGKTTVKTIWGEMAWQLGGEAAFAKLAEAEPQNKESDMKADQQPVEVAAQVETPEAVESEKKQDEVQPVEETPAEATEQAVEAETPEGEPATEQAQAPAPEAKPLSREEFTKIADEFGADIAVQTVRDGGDYSTALRLAFDASKAEAVTLRGRVAELEAKTKSGGQAVPVTAAEKKTPKLFNTGK